MDPATVEVNFPSSSQRSDSTPAVNGQYNNFGGGDALLNRLPPVIQKHFWTIVTILVVLNCIWLIIIFSIAVAALRQVNNLEDDMTAIFKGETDILRDHAAEIEHLNVLTHPYPGCEEHNGVDSIYHVCLVVSNVPKNYTEAKRHCDTMDHGKIAFPRSGSEFSVLASLAVSNNTGEPLRTFLGIMHDGTKWVIETMGDDDNDDDHEGDHDDDHGDDHDVMKVGEEARKNFWELGNPDMANNGNCGVLERGPNAFNKMVSADCDTEAYFICAIPHEEDFH